MTNKERYVDILKAINLGFLSLTDLETEFINNMYYKNSDNTIENITWSQQKKLIQIWEKIE